MANVIRRTNWKNQPEIRKSEPTKPDNNVLWSCSDTCNLRAPVENKAQRSRYPLDL